MIKKADKERKGTLGLLKPIESGDANEIKYRKELKKKGMTRRKKYTYAQ